ncbi:MAG: methyltransferase [bacterium]
MINKVPYKFLTEIKALLSKFGNIRDLNNSLEDRTGIIDFFKSPPDLEEFEQFLDGLYIDNIAQDLGDFQTPIYLTDKICKYLVDTGFAPDIVIEPTCGEGNFVISAIKIFPALKYIYCIDVQSKYEWLFKLNILKLSFAQNLPAKIEFWRDNIFEHRLSHRFKKLLNAEGKRLLILGNPPWVTCSKLSVLNSNNLPIKANIKHHKGIDAITGKGNFDIAENIILRVIQQLCDKKGKIAMLCKSSVIKNIVKDIPNLNLKISNIQAMLIDAKREFNINAEGALLVADINIDGEGFCSVSSLYEPNIQLRKYGWLDNKFVSDIELYKENAYMDGHSPVEWRQGVKHDAEKIMVLRFTNGGLLNGLQESVEVEAELLYPFIKGSELVKKQVIRDTVNKIIITQTSPQEDTIHIKSKHPRLWNYLVSHSRYLDKRKSIIYKKRPRFSIFGIGDYSFKPYKVAISGLYKEPKFSLIFPSDNKPVMLDDTCYYLSFDSLNEAFFTWVLLNRDEVKKFLSSVVFLDSKRPYTKEILMRIDISKLAVGTSFDDIISAYNKRQEKYLEFEFKETEFVNFKNSLVRGKLSCLELFDAQPIA